MINFDARLSRVYSRLRSENRQREDREEKFSHLISPMISSSHKSDLHIRLISNYSAELNFKQNSRFGVWLLLLSSAWLIKNDVGAAFIWWIFRVFPFTMEGALGESGGINIQLLLCTNAEIYGLMIPARLVRVIHWKLYFFSMWGRANGRQYITLEIALERITLQWNLNNAVKAWRWPEVDCGPATM